MRTRMKILPYLRPNHADISEAPLRVAAVHTAGSSSRGHAQDSEARQQ